MKTVAYLRVSTPQQDVSSQRLAILEYAQKHDLHIDDFIEATASGQASEKRRRLDELTSALQPGDRLVVSELSRLGRSLGQVIAVLDALAKAGVAFVALKENIRVEGKRDIQTKVMTTLYGRLHGWQGRSWCVWLTGCSSISGLFVQDLRLLASMESADPCLILFKGFSPRWSIQA